MRVEGRREECVSGSSAVHQCYWAVQTGPTALPPPTPAGSTVLDFYTDERIKLLYKHNLCHIANRVSSLTGVK